MNCSNLFPIKINFHEKKTKQLLRFNLNSSKCFDYMKNLDFETEIKQKLKDLFGKYFYYQVIYL